MNDLLDKRNKDFKFFFVVVSKVKTIEKLEYKLHMLFKALSSINESNYGGLICVQFLTQILITTEWKNLYAVRDKKL